MSMTQSVSLVAESRPKWIARRAPRCPLVLGFGIRLVLGAQTSLQNANWIVVLLRRKLRFCHQPIVHLEAGSGNRMMDFTPSQTTHRIVSSRLGLISAEFERIGGFGVECLLHSLILHPELCWWINLWLHDGRKQIGAHTQCWAVPEIEIEKVKIVAARQSV